MLNKIFASVYPDTTNFFDTLGGIPRTRTLYRHLADVEAGPQNPISEHAFAL